jgi:diguanylate cyclase (GGDEF)-like protein
VPIELPPRPMSILLVCREQNEGNLLRVSLEELLGAEVRRIDLATAGERAVAAYKERHPDVVLIYGMGSGHSEAIIIESRKLDENRHTGFIVIAPKDELFERVAITNLNVGADDVMPADSTLSVIRLKLITIFNNKLQSDKLRALLHKYQAMNHTDELTGLANMRGFIAKFAKSFEKCQAGSCGIAVIMLDLDHFKKVNDTTNHMVGSFVIKSVGQIIGQQLGQQIGVPRVRVTNGDAEDFAGRFGGDEYVIVLHGQNAKNLLNKAELIRRSIEERVFSFQGYNVSVTCSQGLCWVNPKFSGEASDLVKGADAMLYRSKNTGRNLIMGMDLRYPVDFNQIGRAHMIDWDSGRDNNCVSGRDKP